MEQTRSSTEPARSEPPKHSNAPLFVIAGFKLLKSLAMVAIGIGAFSMLGKDVGELASQLVAQLRVDPENRYIHALLIKLGFVDDRALKQIGIGTFLYAALQLTEGIGLFLRKRWAEWLTVVATSTLIPIELYEIFKRVTWTKLSLL